MTARFRARKNSYINKEEKKLFYVWHPQIKVGKHWCYLPDDNTRTKMAEAPDEETAVELAIHAIHNYDKCNAIK
jgi:hypothetical protein